MAGTLSPHPLPSPSRDPHRCYCISVKARHVWEADHLPKWLTKMWHKLIGLEYVGELLHCMCFWNCSPTALTKKASHLWPKANPPLLSTTNTLGPELPEADSNDVWASPLPHRRKKLWSNASQLMWPCIASHPQDGALTSWYSMIALPSGRKGACEASDGASFPNNPTVQWAKQRKPQKSIARYIGDNVNVGADLGAPIAYRLLQISFTNTFPGEFRLQQNPPGQTNRRITGFAMNVPTLHHHESTGGWNHLKPRLKGDVSNLPKRDIYIYYVYIYIPRKSKSTKLCYLCPLVGSGILAPWIILKTSHFVWSAGLPGYILRSTPHPVTVTTRIITFLVGNPYKPSFATATGWGVDPTV